MGRPTDYSVELGEEIAARSAQGASLRTICEADEMPSLRSVQTWRNVHPEFDQLLLRAHLDKATIHFEESIDIADEPVFDTAGAMRQKLRVQARQFAAARLNPAKYAEKIGIGGAPQLPALAGTNQIDDVVRRLAYLLLVGKRRLDETAEPARLTFDAATGEPDAEG